MKFFVPMAAAFLLMLAACVPSGPTAQEEPSKVAKKLASIESGSYSYYYVGMD